jgi:transposase
LSNRKKRKRSLPLEANPGDYVVLREDNKKEIAEIFRYSIETVEAMLEKAWEQGYDAVRLSLLHAR